MSKIVNNGIQKQGIIDSSPKFLNKKDYNVLSSLLNDKEKTIFENHYIKSEITKDIIKDFPTLTGEVYKLKKDNLEINKITDKAFLLEFSLISFSKTEAFSNLQLFPKDIELFDYLQIMDKNKKEEFLISLFENSKNIAPQIFDSIKSHSIKEIYISYGMNLEKSQNAYILKTGGQMLLISLLGAFCSILVVYIAAKIAAKLATNLRHDIFTKVESFSNNEFDKFSTATLITRSTNDVTQNTHSYGRYDKNALLRPYNWDWWDNKGAREKQLNVIHNNYICTNSCRNYCNYIFYGSSKI